MTTTQQPPTPRLRPRWRFALHYVEMLAAMGVGMMTLHPLWQAVVGGQPADGWVHRADVDSLVMATAMVVPMALWMRFRGHGAAPVAEMSLAMYGGFVVLFPFLWTGALDGADLTMIGHVLMPAFMLGAMLARRREYTHSHGPGPVRATT